MLKSPKKRRNDSASWQQKISRRAIAPRFRWLVCDLIFECLGNDKAD